MGSINNKFLLLKDIQKWCKIFEVWTCPYQTLKKICQVFARFDNPENFSVISQGVIQKIFLGGVSMKKCNHECELMLWLHQGKFLDKE